jgi:hypothetical protein
MGGAGRIIGRLGPCLGSTRRGHGLGTGDWRGATRNLSISVRKHVKPKESAHPVLAGVGEEVLFPSGPAKRLIHRPIGTQTCFSFSLPGYYRKRDPTHEVHMFDNTKKKSAEIRNEIAHRAAQGAAQGAERLAVETEKTADSVRAWANGLGRSKSRGRAYVGLGIMAALIAVAAYLMTSRGEKHREQLQELGGEVIDKVAS